MKMIMLRKIISVAKRSKGSPSELSSTSRSEVDNKDFEKCKTEWQSELSEMSNFLVMKSTTEQLDEGATVPTDTAIIDDNSGLPLLKVVFDVHHFLEDQVKVTVENDQLILHAENIEERDIAVFKKTMIRKVDLPGFVDGKRLHCARESDLLTVSLPLHLPPKRRPPGVNVVPIVVGTDGRRRIHLVTELKRDFTVKDVQVSVDDKQLCLSVLYNVTIPGQSESKVIQRELMRKYRLPEYIKIEEIIQTANADDCLVLDVIVTQEVLPYKCEITTEQVQTPESRGVEVVETSRSCT